MLSPTDLVGHETLRSALATARALGFLGPAPVEEHIRHALRFQAALGARMAGRALDLGAGGGLPGLVLALADPGVTWTFLDAHQRRTSALEAAVRALGLGAHVSVVTARAEVFGRDPANRAAYDLVVARSFGPPAVVAECAAPLLRLHGHLAVSEPPEGKKGERWPAAGLAAIALAEAASPDPGIAVLQLVGPVDHRYPRRVGIPAKRPLF